MAHRTSARRPNGPAPALPEPARLPARRIALPWPASRYVPGSGPHPLRPGGHGGCGLAPDAEPAQALDRGLDLLAGHFVWEAHEAFEIAWRALDAPTDRRAPFGLIKLCAAILRANAGDHEAAIRLLAAGERALADQPTLRGTEVAPIMAAAASFVAACARGAEDRPLALHRAAGAPSR